MGVVWLTLVSHRLPSDFFDPKALEHDSDGDGDDGEDKVIEGIVPDEEVTKSL